MPKTTKTGMHTYDLRRCQNVESYSEINVACSVGSVEIDISVLPKHGI